MVNAWVMGGGGGRLVHMVVAQGELELFGIFGDVLVPHVVLRASAAMHGLPRRPHLSLIHRLGIRTGIAGDTVDLR